MVGNTVRARSGTVRSGTVPSGAAAHGSGRHDAAASAVSAVPAPTVAAALGPSAVSVSALAISGPGEVLLRTAFLGRAPVPGQPVHHADGPVTGRRPAGRVALATAARTPDGMEDTAGLLAALEARAVPAEVVVWDDPAVDWSRFGCVVLHSTGDHPQRRDDFRAWLRDRDRVGRPVLANPRDLLARTDDKAYLLDLAARGIAVPSTLRVQRGAGADPRALWERLGPVPLVVKPAVGGGGRRVWRTDGPEPAAALARDRFPAEPVIIQEYRPEVCRTGEWSVVVFDGRISHAVRQLPGPGDLRGHRRYGATRTVVPVEPWMRGYARRVLTALGAVPLYARIDLLLPDTGRPLLMGVEVLQPDLYLRDVPGAAERFAAALDARVRARSPRSGG